MEANLEVRCTHCRVSETRDFRRALIVRDAWERCDRYARIDTIFMAFLRIALWPYAKEKPCWAPRSGPALRSEESAGEETVTRKSWMLWYFFRHLRRVVKRPA